MKDVITFWTDNQMWINKIKYITKGNSLSGRVGFEILSMSSLYLFDDIVLPCLWGRIPSTSDFYLPSAMQSYSLVPNSLTFRYWGILTKLP